MKFPDDVGKGICIFLCDITGKMAKPWFDDGYTCILVDPKHPRGVTVSQCGRWVTIGEIIDHPTTWSVISAAIRTNRVVFVAGFPPCTDLAVSGARWFEEKRKADPLYEMKAMHVVWQCQVIGELSGGKWFAENPVSRISSFWRRPDHAFHPFQYTGFCAEDNYKKKTCLWVGGGFVMPDPYRDYSLGAPDNRIHTCAPGDERANIRSETPTGFAIAVHLANRGPRKGQLDLLEEAA
ncbi:TPA: hypothetical protein ACVGL4_000573 [Pseudomonas aeruginosa]